jgi:hypothetical protein
MESKKINQLATELAPELSDLTIIGDPTTGISKKITLSQMASLFTGTVEEYASLSAFPLVGAADTIYIALDTNIIYRWNTGTSAYVELSPNIVTSLVFNDANGFDGTISLVGSTATLTITTALTTGSVGFIGASGALLQDNANFFWDNSNKRLGINSNAPTTALDVFGSGIIGRVNGTSTNNAFLGFASAGSNKWSIGNVQSDHRFRIYSEANTSELVSVLQTGEFGIGIANPTTKLHIDGGASALIANLDANVSVAKSVSFRSDNSNRINLEVSGTESGSNAGANFFLRAYSDAGALLSTPLTITRSTGAAAFSNTVEGTIFNSTSNVYRFSGNNALSLVTLNSQNVVKINAGGYWGVQLVGANDQGLLINNVGAATFSNSVTTPSVTNGGQFKLDYGANASSRSWRLISDSVNFGDFSIQQSTTQSGSTYSDRLLISANGISTFSNTIIATSSGYPLDLTGNTNNYGIRLTSVQAPSLFLYSTFNNSSNRNWGIYSNSNVFGDFDIRQSNAKDGDMTAGANSTSRFYINNNGYIGLGTTSPNDKLVVQGVSNVWAAKFISNNGQSDAFGVQIFAGTTSNDTSFRILNAATTSEYLKIRGDGYMFSTPTYNNTWAGYSANMYIASDGSFGRITASSIRFKENINEWNGKGLQTILALKPKTYKYKKEYCESADIDFLGLIAEEVAEVSPYLAQYENPDRTGLVENVRYDTIVVPLISAIQELKAEIELLKSK